MVRTQHVTYWAPAGDGTGGGTGGSNGTGGGNSGFLHNAMSLFSKSAAPAQKASGTIDTSTFKFDPITGQPIKRAGDPTNLDDDKSKPNPLDNFKDMFDTSKSTSNTDKAPSFKLDPAKLKTLTDSLDFSGHLTPELQEKLKSGDPEAMREALNGLGRDSYSKMMEHLPALTEAYVDARLQHSQKGLGKSVKSTLTKQSLDKMAADNPILKRQLETVGDQLLEQFPSASPEWIAEQVPQYFVKIAQMLSPDSFVKEKVDPDTSGEPGTSSFDWDGWIQGKKPAAPNK